MGRGCSAAGFWLGWLTLIVVGCAGFAGLLWIVFTWETLTNYGLALAWTGLTVGVLGALAEWLALPALLIAALVRRHRDRQRPIPPMPTGDRRGPGIATYIAGGLAALVLGRIVVALG